jgi:nicotinate-nucleotide adenylyltransferase
MAGDAGSSRVLIFGGTFDPPHRAHIELPQAAARELGCDRILFIPASINPLKCAPGQSPPTPAQDRVAMLRLALRDVPRVDISEIELRREGPSYTIDTLRALAVQARPEVRHLLIGADQALDFHRWNDWREVLRIAAPAVMLRPPWTHASFAAALRERYDEAESQAWEARTLHTLPLMDISATEIRARVAAGEPLADLVPPDVEAYVREHGLYAK